jgi:threonine synthase
MRFVSTRNATESATLSAAIAAGLAPDGGLYVPKNIPQLATTDFESVASLPDVAERLLRPYFAGDTLESELASICTEAFDFPCPNHQLGTPGDSVLELFHGPTAAFKDFGARFLATTLARLRREATQPLTILVATSGDTGAAVAAAFHRQPGLHVLVLYPDGRVSPRQAHQLGCFGDNVQALRVAGSFDDCQALVKQALNDASLQARVPLSSANSISLGRLLPQMAYYAHAVIAHACSHGDALNFVIPTGNLGNALAAVLVRAMGLPIGRIVLASNANDVLPQFFAGKDYAPRPSIPTLANAMDVGAPSNFERLRWLYPDAGILRRTLSACAVDDEAIRHTIQERYQRHGEVHCPHTACAVRVLEDLRQGGASGPWCVVSTAHPAKFESVVEPLIGRPVPVPPALASLLQRPCHADPLPADYAALLARLDAWN